MHPWWRGMISTKFHSCNPLQPGFSKPLLKIICFTLSGNKCPIFYWNRGRDLPICGGGLRIWGILNKFLPIFLTLATTTLPVPEVPGAPKGGIFWVFCRVDRVDLWLSYCQIRTWLSLGLGNQSLLLHQPSQLPALSHALASCFPILMGSCLKQTN